MLSDEEIVLKRLKETLDVLKGKNVITRLDFQIRDMVEDCIRVIEEQQKNNENWKKYCDEQENDITLKNNKICDLEFKIEKQTKEIEEYKKQLDLDYVDKHFVPIERYNQLEKEIEELKNGQIDFWISDKEIEERIRNKFVSKDKIKAKIEELNDLNSPFAQRVLKGKEVYLTEMVQNILQSLLEKE